MSGDERTARFEQAFLCHLDAAYNLARWLTRSAQDAEDLVQKSFLRAFEHYDSFRGDSPRAWLLAIVRNACYSHLRRRAPSGETAEFDERIHSPETSAGDPEAVALREFDGKRLAEALEDLPDEYREALVLRELEEMSYKEIAAVLGIPIGTVMSRLNRGRDRLRACLAGEAAKEPRR